MNARRRWIGIGIAVFVATVAGVSIHGTTRSGPTQELVIFHAGSLSVPFAQISNLFEQEHPDVLVKAEAAGSRQCARKICDLGRQCDIIASADYKVVENLLMPNHVDFNICFATNEMAIAYTIESRYSDHITEDNWCDVMLRGDLALGRSDPDLDPCGYRTLMVFQLAELHYGRKGLAQRLQARDEHIRPKETDLLALLEAGEIDYLFIYRSVASQHGLEILTLPDQVNLKSADLAQLYNTATVKVTGTVPGQHINRRGEAMVYSVSIPRDAPNREAAEAWIALLLSQRGQAIMEKNGQPCIKPPIADRRNHLPESLKLYCL